MTRGKKLFVTGRPDVDASMTAIGHKFRGLAAEDLLTQLFDGLAHGGASASERGKHRGEIKRTALQIQTAIGKGTSIQVRLALATENDDAILEYAIGELVRFDIDELVGKDFSLVMHVRPRRVKLRRSTRNLARRGAHL